MRRKGFLFLDLLLTFFAYLLLFQYLMRRIYIYIYIYIVSFVVVLYCVLKHLSWCDSKLFNISMMTNFTSYE
jgi:hypothetical protein